MVRREVRAERRKCWAVDVGGALAGVVIRKDETRSDAKVIKSAGERILKLCTFIMGPRFRGEKFSEQLLKQCPWFAQANSYDVVYVTAFPSKEELIQLLNAYGFTVTGRQDNGELVMEKVLKRRFLSVDDATDILALDRASYPRFYDGVRTAKYCVPVQGAYHEKLFPESASDRSLRCSQSAASLASGRRRHARSARPVTRSERCTCAGPGSGG